MVERLVRAFVVELGAELGKAALLDCAADRSGALHREAMEDISSATDGGPIVGRLVSAVRLPSGALRDDVGIVVISP